MYVCSMKQNTYRCKFCACEWGLTKKMNTHTLCFCPLIRKLQAFEILKWAEESQWTKQRTSNFTREIQLIYFITSSEFNAYQM